LSPIENLLADYLGNERQALVLARIMYQQGVELTSDSSPQAIEDAVILALVNARETILGPTPRLEQISGHRRDKLR